MTMHRGPAAEAALARRLEKARTAPARRVVPLAERIAKCHGDVRSYIGELERRAQNAEGRADALEAALANEPHADSDTVLSYPGGDDVPDRGLPPGSTITFGGLFEVAWVPDPKSPARRGLRVASWAAALAILPVDADTQIIHEAGE